MKALGQREWLQEGLFQSMAVGVLAAGTALGHSHESNEWRLSRVLVCGAVVATLCATNSPPMPRPKCMLM